MSTFDVDPALLNFGVGDVALDAPTCVQWPMTCWEPPDDPDVARILWEGACEFVWAVTGRRVGICTYRAWFGQPSSGETCLPSPALVGGRWYNVLSSPVDCHRLRLDPGPVTFVHEVTVDGRPYSAWRLSGDWLISTGGCWPAQAQWGPRTHVVWSAGVEPPAVCLSAAAEVADELVRACGGDPSCRLPSNVVSITRQGVTVQMGDPAALLDKGLTGMPRVDMAIRALNPNTLSVRSQVFSPDFARPVWG